MAIPGQPSNFYTQQGNGQVLLSWDAQSGATSYSVQRSDDEGISFTEIGTPGPTISPSYKDTTAVLNTLYYYQVAAVNSDGTSPYTEPQGVVPTTSSEMCLSELRTRSQQRADRLNSEFLSTAEWNNNINQSMLELYDLLITTYEDYYVTTPAQFMTNGNTYLYPLPNGVDTYVDTSGANFIAKPFYKLIGVDLGINNANNAWVTLNRFNFIDRNRFVYPNTASTIYGVFNLQYRPIGDKLELIPTPSANQPIRLWYVPRLDQLLEDKDVTTVSISGWIEYVIVDAAIKALQKEESDVSILMSQKASLIKRIEETAANRDAGQPDHISDVSQGARGGFGFSGPSGGY